MTIVKAVKRIMAAYKNTFEFVRIAKEGEFINRKRSNIVIT